MSTRKTLVQAALTLALLGAVTAANSAGLNSAGSQAAGVQVRQGVSLDLGSVSGVAFYTREDSGYRVVLTLAATNSQNAMRFETVLGADQSVTLSTPSAPGILERKIELTRKGDKIVVTTAGA